MTITPKQFAECIVDTMKIFPSELDRHPDILNMQIHATYTKHSQIMKRYMFQDNQTEILFYKQIKNCAEIFSEQGHDIETPQAQGIGRSAVFYKISDFHGLRLEPGDVRRLDCQIMLPAIHSSCYKTRFGSNIFISTAEFVPLVDISGNTASDVDALVRLAKSMELRYGDPTLYNQGPYLWPENDIPVDVVINPGALTHLNYVIRKPESVFTIR